MYGLILRGGAPRRGGGGGGGGVRLGGVGVVSGGRAGVWGVVCSP